MYKNICPHCKTEFEFKNHQQFGSHKTNCKLNPKINEKIEKQKLTLKNKNPEKEYIFNCKGCNKEYTLLLKLTDYNKDNYKKFCCLSCATKYSLIFL
jgi:hypothetical protein